MALNSSNTKRGRSAWCPRILKSETDGKFEMSLWYKNSRGNISPYSRSAQNVPIKTPWGPPDGCDFGTEETNDSTINYFRFERGQTAIKFYLNTMNALVAGVNEFSQNFQSMVTRGQFSLLAQYMSLLPKSFDFTYHHPDLVNEVGIKIDGTGIQEEGLLEHGGSIEGLKKFIAAAQSSATVVGRVAQPNKRAIESTGKKPNRPTKKPKISPKSRFEEEIIAEDGIEKQYSKTFIGSFEVKLELLSVDPSLKRNLSYFHIQGLKKQMLTRFDPSLLCITVRPANVSTFNPEEPELSEYFVVQGIHSFQALKEIEKDGVNPPGINDGMYTVHVVNTEEKELILYGHLRSNSLASVFVKKPAPQNLLTIFGELLNKQGLKLIERMAKLQLLGPAETKAVLDLCKWPDNAFKDILDVLNRFETYDTLDVRENIKATVHLNEGKLRRGQVHTLTNKMLVRLSKVTPDHLSSEKENVINKTKSLKTVIEEFEIMRELSKVIKLVENWGKCGIEELRVRHTNKLSNEILQRYIGAEVSGTVSNVKGELLKKYFDSVVNEKDEDSFLELKEISSTKTVSEVVNDIITKCDSLVINFYKRSDDDQSELMEKIADNDIKSILLFPNESLQLDALSSLRLKESDTFHVQQILFEKEKYSKNETIGWNIDFGILCGNLLTLHDGPIAVFNGNKDNLSTMLTRIVPPGGKIVSITDISVDPVVVHKKDLSRRVSYYCYSEQMGKIKTKIQEEGTFIHEDNIELSGEHENTFVTETVEEINPKKSMNLNDAKNGTKEISKSSEVKDSIASNEDSIASNEDSINSSDLDETYNESENRVEEETPRNIRYTLGAEESLSVYTSTPKSNGISNSLKSMESRFGMKQTFPAGSKIDGTKKTDISENVGSPYDFEKNSGELSESPLSLNSSPQLANTGNGFISCPTAGNRQAFSESQSSSQETGSESGFGSFDSATIFDATLQPPTGIELIDGKVNRFFK